jgi:hypothetical protein
MQDKVDFDTTFSKGLLTDSDKTITRVAVEDEAGNRAIGFLSAKLVNGRVRFTLTVKKNKCKETITHATADWVL